MLMLAVVAGLALCLALLVECVGSFPNGVFWVRMESSHDGLAQLFYDRGNGLNEADSATVEVHAGAIATYRFPLPAADFRGWRFDPMNHEATITIYAAGIEDAKGRTIREIAAIQFAGQNQIERTTQTADAVVFQTTAGAYDPMLQLSDAVPVSLQPGFWGRLWRLLPWAILPAALVGCLAWIAQLPRASRVRAWTMAHPRTTILIVAAVSVGVQMHPVIFAGRSMVSPWNGPVLMLYDKLPPLPGTSMEEPEQVFGSDVGAVMWDIVPQSALQHDAVLKDHELPLWNRNVFAGVPLLGQGTSMFGNPFQFLAILANGSAWAWDVHYVAARFLFAFGIGLAAWNYGAGLAGSITGACLSAFIGYFGFRFNHMAGFSVSYAPWILAAWAGIRNAGTSRELAGWVGVLALTTICLITSGAVKEGYMLVAVLHLAGLSTAVLTIPDWRQHAPRLCYVLLAGIGVVLLTAPLWWPFFRALSQSVTAYDTPRASQIAPWKLAGFFDDIFYRLATQRETHFDPAVNLAVLFGLAWSLARGGVGWRSRTWVALAVASLLPFSLVFGIIPPSWIVEVPFVRNIIHIDNTFSCCLVVMALVLACFGWQRFLCDIRTTDAGTWRRMFFGLAVLFGAFFASSHGQTASLFFSVYVPISLLAITVLPWIAHRAATGGRQMTASAALLAAVLFCTWRYGQYVTTPLDDYVANPGSRVNLAAPSPALTAVKAALINEPGRAHGFGQNLFPGYPQMLRVETVYGVSPLRNPEYQEIATLFGWERLSDICGIADREDQAAVMARSRDFLNVRYYLAAPQVAPRTIGDLRETGQYDLDVFRSDSAWPRAFFTDSTIAYTDVGTLVDLIQRGDGRPFAAIRTTDLSSPQPATNTQPAPGRIVVPARDYRFTTNTTTFTIDAPTAGMVVLGETFYPEDFRATINNVPAPYLRVNHAFKGITINAPGSYRIAFEYWPRYFTASLVASGAGALLLTALLLWLARSARPV